MERLRMRLFIETGLSPTPTMRQEDLEELETVITPDNKGSNSNNTNNSGFDSLSTTPVLSSNALRRRRSFDVKRSLFNEKVDGLRVEYEDLIPCHVTKRQRFDSHARASNIIEAVDRLSTEADLVADGSRVCCLPTILGKHGDLKYISIDTGAINMYTQDSIHNFLLDNVTSSQKHVLIFHCEFSSERGPKMNRFLRSTDRDTNKEHYPRLHFPEIYLLQGGYKAFYEAHKSLCDPESYTPMLHEQHAADLRHFRVKSKSWAAGDKEGSSVDVLKQDIAHKMVFGVRVVRGPDWENTEEDGGPDHVGTVVEIKGNNSVSVQWDVGTTSVCRCGVDGKHDVIIFDSAPIGITHRGVRCKYCYQCCTGTRWTCSVCTAVNLCTPCYYDDEHDVHHPFLRIDLPGQQGILLPKRSESTKSRSKGIFASSKVKRGRDWEYEDQDGGPASIGHVNDVVRFNEPPSDRDAIQVKWDQSNTTFVYRLGYGGKVDLQTVEPAPGADFYRNHLATLDLEALKSWVENPNLIRAGEKVCVTLIKDELRKLQQQKYGWKTGMENIVGAVGTLKRFTLDGDMEVDFGKELYTLRPGAVQLVPIHNLGDMVTVTTDMDLLKRLQESHSCWDDDIVEVMGKEGKVTAIDKDGDVGVVFGKKKEFVFHPFALTLSPHQLLPEVAPPDDMDVQENITGNDDERPGTRSSTEQCSETSDGDGGTREAFDITNIQQILTGFATLLVEQYRPTDIDLDFVKACVAGNAELVKNLLQKKPIMTGISVNDIPILILTVQSGNLGVCQVLIETGCDINIQDNSRNTPMMKALILGYVEMAEFLIGRGANLCLANMNGSTPLHVAAHKNMPALVKLMLERSSNPNAQDADGDTPLNDAINEHSDAAASLLIQDARLNLRLKNKHDLTSFSFACMKGQTFVVDKLLSRDPTLATCPAKNSMYPLHIAAFDNYVNVAKLLLHKGNADINATNADQMTPLHIAVSQAHFDMVKLLLTNGANLAQTDYHGNTALHICLIGHRQETMVPYLLGVSSSLSMSLSEENDRIKIAKFLIQYGAQLSSRNIHGVTPLVGCTNQRMRNDVTLFAASN